MYKKIICRVSILLVVLSSLTVSCRKDEKPGYSYFVSKEFVSTYNQNYINSVIDVISTAIPEAGDLEAYVGSGIDIYKIVYETTIKGEKVNASGLICVPSEPGEYPVLSFQNGTNTEFDKAPTEAPEDYLYQLVEVIASMGYVVVFADYPGFGESTGVVHPYLIAEPTVQSITDMFRAVRELNDNGDFEGITITDDYYLMGYSQGGWSTLQLHKALELEYNNEFDLKGSCCGAGPYNLYLLLQDMVGSETYPMPIYIAYIINSYKAYDQFTNPVTDIINDPYATAMPSLFNGQLSSGEINTQLTTSIPGLINPDFLAGFDTDPKYSSVREALVRNSISAWKTNVPLLLVHGDEDTDVDPSATEDMYAAMIDQGTSQSVLTKVILPGAGHGEGVAPGMIMGLLFLEDIKNEN